MQPPIILTKIAMSMYNVLEEGMVFDLIDLIQAPSLKNIALSSIPP